MFNIKIQYHKNGQTEIQMVNLFGIVLLFCGCRFGFFIIVVAVAVGGI